MTNKTLISFEVANISFLKFSATEYSLDLSSNLEIFVTPSTRSAISLPNNLLTSRYVASVSSIVSCSKAVVIVAVSTFKSHKIAATAMG